MKQSSALFCALFLLSATASVQAGNRTDLVAAERLRGGLIILVNARDETYDEAAETACTVRGLENEPARVHALRRRLHAADLYGRLSVTAFRGGRLPVIDNLANIVVLDDGADLQADALRVLAPGGTLLVRKGAGLQAHSASFPPSMGEWNQYLCKADNNGVTRDSAGPPERLQWTAGSRYGRVKVVMPSVTSLVTANGRLFTVEDVGTVESITPKKQYVLLARDAFNGCELWRHPLPDWDKEKLGPVKIIPVQLQRLLAAIGDRVYCTEGYDGPVTAFDGATGDVVTTFANTGNTREFACADGVLYGIRGPAYAFGLRGNRVSVADMAIGDVTLYARNASDGAPLWKTTIPGSEGGPKGYIGGTLAIRGTALTYLTRTQLVCRDSRTGSEVWRRQYPFWEDMPRKGARLLTYHTSPPTIVMTDTRLFVVELDRVKAYATADGALLWEGRTECNYTKNGDLFVANGLVWNGFLEGLDPATGTVRRRMEQSRIGPMVHPRCYRNRITHQYYINSKTGGTDLLALDGSGEFPSPWMRATCGLATTPSYGRLYSSPYVCACEIGTMLLGFNCTYTQSRAEAAGKVMTIGAEPRLIRGPAFGAATETPNATGPAAPTTPEGRRSQDADGTARHWNTYRHDSRRSGVTPSPIPRHPQVAWQVTLPGQPTAPVIADGLLLTAVRDQHTVYALDSRTGRTRWHFTADGRVDSPPTLYRGLALFGSRDGWVYCLDARTGQLVWTFTDTPTVRLMCAMEQLESAWPVNGSVMVHNGLVYLAAGRTSFLDGGVVLYALRPETGEVVHRRVMAGPYDEHHFPRTQRGRVHRSEGFKSGIFSAENGILYIRHQAFRADLTPISPYELRKPHLMASTGFLCAGPQHRTYWTIDTELSYGPAKGYDTDGPNGDIIAVDGDTFYEVRGDAPGRHTGRITDPLKKYRLVSGTARTGRLSPHKDPLRTTTGGPLVPAMGNWNRRWTTHIPMAGHAILVGGKTLAVAGVPMRSDFAPDEVEAAYEGRNGGVLWTVDRETGTPLGELPLSAPPVWDGLAAADGRVYLPLKNGTVLCLGSAAVPGKPPISVLPTEWQALAEDREKARQATTGPVTLYRDDFEARRPGEAPGDVTGADPAKGTRIVVTDAVAASGKHALAVHDAPGLDHAWMPLYTRTFDGAGQRSSGTATLSFDVMMTAETPGQLNVTLRDYSSRPIRSPVSVLVLPEGAIQVNGKTIRAPNGAWHTVELALELGAGKGRRVRGSVTLPDGRKQRFTVPFQDDEFSTLTWLGLFAGSQTKAVIYVDNVVLKVQ